MGVQNETVASRVDYKATSSAITRTAPRMLCLRGKGWQRKHATVNYCFDYSPYRLFKYHELIMQEMTKRGYRVSPEWLDKEYRASRCQPTTSLKRRHYQPSFILSMIPPIYRNVWTISSKKESSSKGGKRCIYLSG